MIVSVRLLRLVRSSNPASVQNSRIASVLIRRNPQTARGIVEVVRASALTSAPKKRREARRDRHARWIPVVFVSNQKCRQRHVYTRTHTHIYAYTIRHVCTRPYTPGAALINMHSRRNIYRCRLLLEARCVMRPSPQIRPRIQILDKPVRETRNIMQRPEESHQLYKRCSRRKIGNSLFSRILKILIRVWTVVPKISHHTVIRRSVRFSCASSYNYCPSRCFNSKVPTPRSPKHTCNYCFEKVLPTAGITGLANMRSRGLYTM